MNRVRCSSCRRTLAVTDSDGTLRNKMYCDEWCYQEPAATMYEDRNDQWKMMVAYGWSPVYVGKTYGVAHSQVYKTVGRG
jgi:hypothetical protein